MDRNRNKTARTFIAGGLAGCVAKTAVGPLDRVKILFQTNNPHYKHHSGSLLGVFRAAKDIYKVNGIFGLYRGHSAMLLRIFPYSAIQFFSYDRYKSILEVEKYQSNPFRRILAGSLAGATSVFFTYPLDTLRARLAIQVKQHEYIGIFSLMKNMTKEQHNPFASFYKGFAPSFYGILPYGGAAFFSFETLKKLYNQNIGPVDDHPVGKLFCGSFAGAIAQTFAYPLDVIRRRLQLQKVVTHLPHYKNTFDAFRKIFAAEGFRGFFVGLSVNYIKVVPASGISFLTYDLLKRYYIQ